MIRPASLDNMDSFANFFNGIRRKLERMAARRGHNDPPDFVGSLAFELFVKNKIPLEKCTQSYLFWVAKKRLCDYHRSRGCEKTLKTTTLVEDAYFPEKSCNTPNYSHSDWIRGAFNNLSQKQLDILERKYLLSQSNREIAKAHSMTENGVRSALQRGKTLLRKLLPIIMGDM